MALYKAYYYDRLSGIVDDGLGLPGNPIVLTHVCHLPKKIFKIYSFPSFSDPEAFSKQHEGKITVLETLDNDETVYEYEGTWKFERNENLIYMLHIKHPIDNGSNYITIGYTSIEKIVD